MDTKKRRSGLCAYCGKVKQLTRDHIPPKNLFPSPRPSNLITVPCCDKCNGVASKDDEYFRLMLVPRMDVFTNPEAKKLWDPVKRSLGKKEKTGFKKSYIDTIKRVPNSRLLTYDVDMNRVLRVADRVIRGLFYTEFRCPIPKEHKLEVFSLDTLKPGAWVRDADLNNLLGALASATAYSIGGSIFQFRALRISESKDEKYTTVWLISFFSHAHFVGFVRPKSLIGVSIIGS